MAKRCEAKLKEKRKPPRINASHAWRPNDKLTHNWRQVKPRAATSAALFWVKASSTIIDRVLDPLVGARALTGMDAATDVLIKVVHKIVPKASLIVAACNYTFMLILELNDWIMDRSVIWCIVFLKRWIRASFPSLGEPNWPPVKPVDDCEIHAA